MITLAVSLGFLILSYLIFISAEKRNEKQKETNIIFDKELKQEWNDIK